MYRNSSKNENVEISLHDSRAKSVSVENGILSFEFPEGFYVVDKSNDKQNNIFYTDLSKVDFSLIDGTDGIESYIFTKTEDKNKDIRETIDFQKLSEMMNNNHAELEFIYTYSGYHSVLFYCWLWSDEFPNYHKECEILIQTDDITYYWNNTYEEK